MVARQGLNWPQVCGGKGARMGLARPFNASLSVFYVLDPGGKIAAKHRGSKGVEVIGRLVEALLSAH